MGGNDVEVSENPMAADAPPQKKKKLGMREAADVARAFGEIDTDASGSLDSDEVRKIADSSLAVRLVCGNWYLTCLWQVGVVVAKLLGRKLTTEELSDVMDKLDTDHSGEVSRDGEQNYSHAGFCSPAICTLRLSCRQRHCFASQ